MSKRSSRQMKRDGDRTTQRAASRQCGEDIGCLALSPSRFIYLANLNCLQHDKINFNRHFYISTLRFLLISFEQLILRKTFYEYIQIICTKIEKNIIVKDRLICYCDTIWKSMVPLEMLLTIVDQIIDIFYLCEIKSTICLTFEYSLYFHRSFYFPNHLEL